MTYSIIARCPRTGQLGIGVASYTMAIGAYCDGAVRPNVGATITQGSPLPRNNRLAVNLLAQGYTPAQALGELIANDPAAAHRQIAIVDREGVGIAHTGARVRSTSGQRIGAGFVALGSMLASEKVLDALVSGFEADSKAELDERMLNALERARDAGGLKGGSGPLRERSVALIVWGKRDYSDSDLRVDLQDDAIAELRRIHIDYKPTAEYYDERARHPRNAIPAMEFADMLKAQQKETS
jgi:uncharacterized Ntn-hydrolase superfamily protein